MAPRGPQDALGSGVALRERLRTCALWVCLLNVPSEDEVGEQGQVIRGPAHPAGADAAVSPRAPTGEDQGTRCCRAHVPVSGHNFGCHSDSPLTRSYVTQHVHHADDDKPVQVPPFRRGDAGPRCVQAQVHHRYEGPGVSPR